MVCLRRDGDGVMVCGMFEERKEDDGVLRERKEGEEVDRICLMHSSAISHPHTLTLHYMV